MSGAASLTVNVMEVELDPAELLAQMVYVVAAVTVSGVPQIEPLLVSNVRPEGKVALMAQVVTPPPTLVGLSVVMSVSLV